MNKTTSRREAFAAMARQHDAALLRTARRLCRNDEDRAQDLVQDALVRAFQAYLEGRFDDGPYAKAWLMRIMTNLFINDYRRRQKWEAGIDLETLTSSGESGPAETHAAPSDIPGVTLLSETLDEDLEKALLMLSEGLRLCVLLVDVEGLEYQEAALALNIPIGTVRSRLARARMQLHDLLQDFARRKRLLS